MQRSLGKDFIDKNFFAECQKSTLGKAFAECPTLGKVGTEKNPKKWEFLPKKIKKFVLIGGGPHRSAPIHLRLFSRQFHGYVAHGYVADGIRTRDLPLRTNLLYHYTTLSLCVWIPFEFLIYYTKPRVNCLFEALNEFK